MSSSRGALMKWKEYEGEAWELDMISAYFSIITKNTFLVPTKRGTFKTIDDFSEHLEFGIYRCLISGFQPDSCWFTRWNEELDWYTSIDIKAFRELGLTIELIHDGKPNFLHYDGQSRVKGDKVFGSFKDELFGFKQQNLPDAKLMINGFIGALSMVDTVTKTVHEESKKIQYLKETEEIHDVEDFTVDAKNGLVVKYNVVDTNSYFETPFARVKPFIYSQIRLVMMRLIRPHLDKVVRIHTDGIILSEKIEVATGNELGDFKYKLYCPHAVIKGMNNITPRKVEWEELE
ncbi:hypothetical protein CAOG_05701 [Capsaspora owczarzaki ATCC 30864]|uniref:hypothetical protein n=1 Tax=Capsaspora owczarzaki (strain ATCC 30864) TaxID=595528 RepID=UPI0001FE5982|nr:hypothetical protein CAOG_05701 [Capsaspora owczarzaki ATCC 30864]|eukprot:XP_004346374.1 hypothetical protein CAOG_05701 [Capsaspora owczarzaki ATCC 30864]